MRRLNSLNSSLWHYRHPDKFLLLSSRTCRLIVFSALPISGRLQQRGLMSDFEDIIPNDPTCDMLDQMFAYRVWNNSKPFRATKAFRDT